MATERIPFHPYAGIFDLIEGFEKEEFQRSIQRHGLMEPIVKYQGMILDGRNRYVACVDLGLDPRFVEFTDIADGMSPLDFVLTKNLTGRRHLTVSQKAMAVLRYKDFLSEDAKKRMDTGTLAQECARVGKAAEHAAKVMGISTRTVENAAKVRKKGDEKLQAAVAGGTVSVTRGARLADLPPAEQRKRLLAANKMDGKKPPEKKVKLTPKAEKYLAAIVKRRKSLKESVTDEPGITEEAYFRLARAEGVA